MESEETHGPSTRRALEEVPSGLSEEAERAIEVLAIVDEYENRVDALRELLDATLQHARELDSVENRLKHISVILALIPRDKRREVLDAMRIPDSPTWARDTILVLVDRFLHEEWGPRLVAAVRRSFTQPPRSPILLNSLLTNAVSAFELHLAELTRVYYECIPQALDAASKEKEFSLPELKALGSIEDAVDVAVSRRIDGLLFGSFAGWRKFYRDGIKIDFETLSIDWAAVQEVFQRRHTIVHNGARATKRYMTETGAPVELGQPLDCTPDYVEACFDELFALGALAAVELFRKVGGEDRAACDELHGIEYRMMLAGKWRLVSRVSSHGLTIPADSATSEVFKVNLWLARKRLEDLDTIRPEVEAWDVSASSDRFKLAKAALLGEADEAFALIPGLLASGDISGIDLFEWPLLNDLRADERFKDLQDTIRSSVEREFAGAAMTPGSGVYHRRSCTRAGPRAFSVPEEQAVAAGARPARCCHAMRAEGATDLT
ncbi:hypothetical protein [Actinotalea subterranea]|uniref:hypothetical protein n=1 Tax=Actinotalea subterranea TaxID=2607497 RepID=UPI0011ED77F4|nr:hypothetical protein [Actinotalea subterranea]